MPDSSQDVLLERLAEEFVERYRRGERPTLGEYVERYPELANDVRDLFPALVKVEELKPGSNDVTGPFALSSELPQERLGDYVLLREVGRGGMGVVYEAVQESLGRQVALKVLPPQALRQGSFLVRFQREAKAAAKLHHTNIVPVFGVGECDGVYYYAMQFIQGEPLDKVLRDVARIRGQGGLAAPPAEPSVAHSLAAGRFSPPDEGQQPAAPDGHSGALASGASMTSQPDYYRAVARVALQVAEALDYAHKQGVLHRDVKPSNLLLDLRGTAWITDFGLAKAEGSDELTQTGDIVGTLRFMAPERFEGQSLPQSDVYGLGVTLYELLTLRPAFDEPNKAKLIEKVHHEPPTPPRKVDPRIPRDLETIVLKCVAKNPRDRYATAAELAEDLERFLADRTIKARRSTALEQARRWCRRNPWVAGLTAAVTALVLAVAVISTGAALWLRTALRDSETQRLRAEGAEQDQKRQLYQGYVTEAKYRRYSRRQGQRFDGLEAIRKALRLLPELDLSEQEKEEQRQLLRDLAISCLTLPDVRVAGEWEGWPEGSYSFDLDEDGELYGRSDQKGNVTVRRIADDREVLHVVGDGKQVGIGFLPGQRGLVVWRSSGTVEGWRFGERHPAFTIRDAGPSGRLRVALDGRTLANALPDGTVTTYDLPDGTVLRREKLPALDYPWLEFSPDGKYLAVASGPYQQPFSLARIGHEQPAALRSLLHVFEVRSAQPPIKLRHPDVIYTFAWYPDSRTIAAGGWNVSNEIHVWDVPSGRKLAEITSQKGGASLLSINRTGDVMLSRSAWNGGVKLWHPQTGQEVLTLPLSAEHFYVTAPDGRLFAREMDGTKIRLKECVPAQVCRTLVRDLRAEKHKQYKTPALHPDGRLLAVSMETGVGLWALPSGREVGFLPTGDTESAVFDSTGALWTYGHAGMLRWPVRAARGAAQAYDVGPPRTVFGVPTFAVHMAVSRDGRVAAAALGTEDALVFHRDRPGQTVRLRHGTDVRFLAVSPDGRFVVTRSGWGGEHAGYKVWDARTGTLLRNLLPKDFGGWVGFTPDGQSLIVQGHWFEVGTWREQPDIDGWWGGCISGDGTLLACHVGEGGIGLFDRKSGRRLAQLSTPGLGRTSALSLNDDGTQLIAVDHDNMLIHVWDLRKLRAELSELDLDWDAPPYPPAPAPQQASLEPPPIAVNLGPLEDDAVLGQQPTPEHLRFLVGLNTFVLTMQPFNFKAYRQRGRAHALLNERRQAIADYSMALDLLPANDPARIDLLARRAGNYLALGEDDKALADVGRIEQLDPSSAAHFRGTQATSLMRAAGLASQRGEPATVLRLLRRAVRIDANHATVHNNLAWQLLTGPREQADAKEALSHARRAVELEPSQATYLNTLGVALYRNDKFDEAVPVLEKSLAASKGESDAFDLFFLAMSHARRGDRAKAQECFDRAVRWVEAQKTLSGQDVAELKQFREEAENVLGKR